MSDTLESLGRKITGAGELESVVRTMKTMAASNIAQYEMAVNSLGDYYRNVALGIIAYFNQEHVDIKTEKQKKNKEIIIGAIVFGSDQGLVGQFNDVLSDFVIQSLNAMPGKKDIWAVGERVHFRLSEIGIEASKLFAVPNSVNAVTPLVGQILINIQQSREAGNMKEFYIFHNRPKSGAGYEQVMQRLLPLDEQWKHGLGELHWLTKNLPQVVGGSKLTLAALIREYLFVSLFRSSAESLASENASRLVAMQRAEKNINELLDDLKQKFNRLRQSSIDEELFDVISGFEALKTNGIKLQINTNTAND